MKKKKVYEKMPLEFTSLFDDTDKSQVFCHIVIGQPKL